MFDWYILDNNHRPVKCNDHMERTKWIKSLPEDQRTGIGCVVEKWSIEGIEVSTVFLGLDHGRWNNNTPILFETAIFGIEIEENCKRYTTWEEAKTGHARIVEEINKQSFSWSRSSSDCFQSWTDYKSKWF
jgi:hypothetical protein